MVPVIPERVCAVCGEPIAPAAEYYDYPGLGICICAECAEEARIPGEYMDDIIDHIETVNKGYEEEYE